MIHANRLATTAIQSQSVSERASEAIAHERLHRRSARHATRSPKLRASSRPSRTVRRGRYAAHGSRRRECRRREYRSIRFGVRQTNQVHAVVKERNHHRQQGRLLTAMQRLGGGEDAGGFARECSGHPQAPVPSRKISTAPPYCRIESGSRERGRSIARVVMRGIGRPLVRHRWVRPLSGRGHGRDGPQPSLHPAMASTPRQICRARAAVLPWRE